MRLLLGMISAALLATPAAALVTGGALTGGSAPTNGGVFTIVANPSGLTVGNNNFQNNSVRAFNEAQGFTLLGALATDVGGSVAAGTKINSHYLNFDPGPSRTVVGTATFDAPILGVIWSRSNLLNSHFLGAAGVTYVNPTLVGFEANNDSASFLGNTVTFRLTASSPGDSWRVITAIAQGDPTGVPEPSSWALLLAGFGLVGFSARRRRITVAA